MFVHAQFRLVFSSTSPLPFIWISLHLSTLNFCHFIKNWVSIAQLWALTGCFFFCQPLSPHNSPQNTTNLYRTETPLRWESRTCTPWQLNTFRNLGWATWLRFTVKLDYHTHTHHTHRLCLTDMQWYVSPLQSLHRLFLTAAHTSIPFSTSFILPTVQTCQSDFSTLYTLGTFLFLKKQTKRPTPLTFSTSHSFVSNQWNFNITCSIKQFSNFRLENL